MFSDQRIGVGCCLFLPVFGKKREFYEQKSSVVVSFGVGSSSLGTLSHCDTAGLRPIKPKV